MLVILLIYQGIDHFKAHIDSSFFTFMSDNVSSVRDVGIKSLEVK